jgi:hypothetical protein
MNFKLSLPAKLLIFLILLTSIGVFLYKFYWEETIGFWDYLKEMVGEIGE